MKTSFEENALTVSSPAVVLRLDDTSAGELGRKKKTSWVSFPKAPTTEPSLCISSSSRSTDGGTGAALQQVLSRHPWWHPWCSVDHISLGG